MCCYNSSSYIVRYVSVWCLKFVLHVPPFDFEHLPLQRSLHSPVLCCHSETPVNEEHCFVFKITCPSLTCNVNFCFCILIITIKCVFKDNMELFDDVLNVGTIRFNVYEQISKMNKYLRIKKNQESLLS